MEGNNLETLLMEEIKVVFKYLLKIGASKEDAEDIVQETLYKTIKNINGINPSKMTAWLFKVAINSYYTLYNKNKRQNCVYLEEKHYAELLDIGVEQQVLDQEFKERVYQTLDQLRPGQKNILILKYELNLSYKEIAEILGITEHGVRMYLYRSRNKFKELWEGRQ